jgi:RNA polymerase sigma-70 factor, ECF subfamily
MLVEQHAAEMYRVAAAIVGEADARDLTQETFVAAWTQLPRLRDPGAFAGWLRRICVNRCRNASLDLDDGLSDRLPDASRDFRLAVEARSILAPAFERLSDDQRAVLALHYGMGYTIAEAADALDVRVGTAKSRLNSGLNVLRRALGSADGGAERQVAR